MTTYNTGNPIGSADPRDLFDNAENLDNAVNTQANDEWVDRLGKSRLTWAGMENQFDADQAGRESEFNADQSSREQEFRTFIASSGYQFAGDYAPGIEITEYNQLIRDSNGEFWRVSGQVDLPYVTTGAGVPEDDALVPAGDAVLRQDLANPDKGALMVRGAVIYVDTIADLQALPTSELVDGQAARITKTGRSGDFVFRIGNLSSDVASDPLMGVYVPATGQDGSEGAWVRVADEGRLEFYGAQEGDELAVHLQYCLNHYNKVQISLSGTIRDYGTFTDRYNYGVQIPSNRTLEFVGGATLKKAPTSEGRYTILTAYASENIHIINPVLVGERDEHLGTSGEWGYGIALFAAKNVTVTNPILSDFWGDGLLVGGVNTDGVATPSENIYIKNPIIDNCRRQGISVTSVHTLLIDGGRITNTNGTLPEAAIDLEPDHAKGVIADVVIRDLVNKGNQRGIAINLMKLDNTSAPFSVTLERVKDHGTTSDTAFKVGPAVGVSGVVNLIDCYSEGSFTTGIHTNMASEDATVNIIRPTVVNNNRYGFPQDVHGIRVDMGRVNIINPIVRNVIPDTQRNRGIGVKVAEGVYNDVTIIDPLELPRSADGKLSLGMMADPNAVVKVVDSAEVLWSEIEGDGTHFISPNTSVVTLHKVIPATGQKDISIQYLKPGIKTKIVLFDSSGGSIRLVRGSVPVAPSLPFITSEVGAFKILEAEVNGKIYILEEMGTWTA